MGESMVNQEKDLHHTEIENGEETNKDVSEDGAEAEKVQDDLEFEYKDYDDISYTQKMLAFIGVVLMSSSMALELGITGPTMTDVLIKTSSNIDQVSVILTMKSILATVTSLGFLQKIDRINGLPIMGISIFVSSFFLASAVWFEDWKVFIFCMLVTGLNEGILGAGCFTMVLIIWGEKCSEFYSVMHMTFVVSLGLGPVLSRFFVLETSQNVDTQVLDLSKYTPSDSNVQYVFAITAAYQLAAGIYTIILFCIICRKIKTAEPEVDFYGHNGTLNSKLHKIIGFGLISILMFFCAGIGVGCRDFLASYATWYLGWSPINSVYISLVFHTTNIIGTLCGIFLEKYMYVKPGNALFMNISVCVVATLALCVTVNLHKSALWGIITALGLGYSTVFSFGLAWLQSINFTGFIFVMIYWVGFSCGSICFPWLLGYLFEHVDPFWFAYVMLSCSVGLLIMAGAITILDNCYRRLEYSHDEKNMEGVTNEAAHQSDV